MLLLWTLLACGPSEKIPTPEVAAPKVTELRGETMGTTWMVKVDGEVAEAPVMDGITGVLETVNRRMSTWRDDSELSAVRRGPGPVAVSDETAFVVSEALALASMTDGAFDPTVQPLVELWGLHGNPRSQPPTDEEVAAAQSQVGWGRVVLGGQSGSRTIDAAGTALDLSAIAKGHAVDRVSDWLAEQGHTDTLVEVGGEVRARGQRDGQPWKLGVDTPREGSKPGSDLAAVVALADQAMATSGNYRNFYDAGGVRVVHTLDPRTGRPVTGSVASATVVAQDCRTADGWATALMVLGPGGLGLAQQVDGLEAMLLLPDGDGFQQFATDGFPAR